MARLPYVAPPGAVTDRIRERRGGTLTALDGMLLHSPEFADGWNGMLGAVRGKSTLPADIRELAILLVAARNGADYEWVAHEPIGRREGLGDAAIGAIRAAHDGAAPPSPDVLSAAQRATLRYADAMTSDVTVPGDLFEELRSYFDDRQLLELTVTVAAYNMVSRVLVALEVSPGDNPFQAG
jgi:alkylhydroperoxidase family enzyme